MTKKRREATGESVETGDPTTASVEASAIDLMTALRAATARERVRQLLEAEIRARHDTNPGIRRKEQAAHLRFSQLMQRLGIAGDAFGARALGPGLRLYFEGRATEAATVFALLAERADDATVRARMVFFARVNAVLLAPDASAKLRKRLGAKTPAERAWQTLADAHDEVVWDTEAASPAYRALVRSPMKHIDRPVVLATLATAALLGARVGDRAAAERALAELKRTRGGGVDASDASAGLVASGVDQIIEWGAKTWLDGKVTAPLLRRVRSVCATARRQGNGVQPVFLELALAEFCLIRGRLRESRRLADRARSFGRRREAPVFEQRAESLLVVARALRAGKGIEPGALVVTRPPARQRTLRLLAGDLHGAFAPGGAESAETLIRDTAAFLADPLVAPAERKTMPDFADPATAICALVALALAARDGDGHRRSRRLLRRAQRVAERHDLDALATALDTLGQANTGWMAPGVACAALDGRARFWSADDWGRAPKHCVRHGVVLIDTRGRRLRERDDLLKVIAFWPAATINALEVAQQVWGRTSDPGQLMNRLHVTLHRIRVLFDESGASRPTVRDGVIRFDRRRIVVVAERPPRRRR